MQKFHFQMLPITTRLGLRTSAAAQRQVVGVLHTAVFIHQRNVAGNLQRAGIGDEHLIGNFE